MVRPAPCVITQGEKARLTCQVPRTNDFCMGVYSLCFIATSTNLVRHLEAPAHHELGLYNLHLIARASKEDGPTGATCLSWQHPGRRPSRLAPHEGPRSLHMRATV